MNKYKIKIDFKEDNLYDFYTTIALLLEEINIVDPSLKEVYKPTFNFNKNTFGLKIFTKGDNQFKEFLKKAFHGSNEIQQPDFFDPFLSTLKERIVYLSEKTEMIKVKGGTFDIGNTRNDKEASLNETPVHPVEITYDYWLGKHQVTDYEYIQYLKDKKETLKMNAGWKNRLGTRAVIDISYDEAKGFCNWLSDQTGLKRAYTDEGHLKDIEKSEGYRLPTEAEWEYAARGGHMKHLDLPYSGHKDPFKVAWFYKNAQRRVHEVGKKKANILGLHDMSGNVFEWCEDDFDDYPKEKVINPLVRNESKFMIVRGGCWMLNPENGRVSSRFSAYNSKYNFVGFRLCRTAL